MSMLQQTVCFIMWLFLIPMLAGIIPSYLLEKGKKKIGTVYFSGWIFMLAFFQIISSIMVLSRQSLSELAWLFSSVMYLMALAGCFVMLVGVSRDSVRGYFRFPSWKNMSGSDRATWVFFICLVCFQLFLSVYISTPDGDDAYYVTHAQIAAQKDTMYLENAYVGGYGALDARHVLAPFPMFIALLSRKSGMHASAVAHTVLPPALIILTYLIYYKVASILFPDHERGKRSVFMALMVGMQMFGSYSIYTNETFFVTRTWQGKSVLANIAIPAAFYILLRICAYTEEERTDEEMRYGTTLPGLTVTLLAVNLVGALASSLGLLLLCFLEGLFLLIIAVRNRRFGVIPAGMVSVLPCVVYILIYVLW